MTSMAPPQSTLLFSSEHSKPDVPAAALELGQFIPYVYHFNMLSDEARMTAFKDAIAHAVLPGTTVLELGGGTAVMSHFAAQAGAKVWCVERNPELAREARRILKVNPQGHRVTIVEADAFDYLPPQPVDVVICEMIHVGMLREKQLSIIDSFKQRYLAAFGPPLPRFIPEAFFQAVQPIQQSFDFFGYHAPTHCFQDPLVEQPRTLELGEPVIYHSASYEDDYSLDCSWEGMLSFTTPGQFNAIRVITKNIVAVLEEQQRAAHWSSQYLVVPIDKPMQVAPGQKVMVSFSYVAGDPIRELRPLISLSS